MARLSIEDRETMALFAAIRAAKGFLEPQKPVRRQVVNGTVRQGVLLSSGATVGIGQVMGSNVVISDGFFAEATRRLRAAGASPAATALGVQTLALIVQSIGFETCRAATDIPTLARALELNAGRVGRVLQQLEAAGLIVRLREGRARPILINPRLAYRGGNKAIDATVKAFDEAVRSLPKD